MRNTSLGILSFANHKLVKAVIYAFVLVAMVVGLSLAPAGVKTVQAATCHAYTDWHNGKSALYVWSPDRDPAIAAFFYGHNGWEGVPNRDYGILQNSPQNRSGGWAIFYISKRWRTSNVERLAWDSDWRWYVFC